MEQSSTDNLWDVTGLTLTIDSTRWHDHLRALANRVPGLIPVAKGNGYGFGLPLLAEETKRLGLRTLAVGTPAEAETIREHFDGDIVVLLPWEPNDPRAVEQARDPKVILTVSRLPDLEILANLGGDRPRVLVEVLTSMRRHGLEEEDLPAVDTWREHLNIEGWTIHLPMRGDKDHNRVEADRLGRAALDVLDAPLWFSHLPTQDYLAMAARLGDNRARLRMGTTLWLGEPGALKTTATVLDVHPIKRGQRVGYWQRPAQADGYVVVVSGGTANGIGLEAPTSAKTLKSRAVSFATGALEAAGRALSPYTILGEKRWFAEPPHMQSSLLILPAKVDPPNVGDELPVDVRNTIATFDQVVFV
ncbi:MAG TPA: alanine racemase [Propionibacterium sp.]|nr:alanine racemase [Propionibacterium sp.]